MDNRAYSILSCYQLLRLKPTGKRVQDLKSQGNSNNRIEFEIRNILKIRILLGVLIANYDGPITSNISTVMSRSFRVLIVKSRLTLSRAEVRMSDNKNRQRSQLVDVIAGNQVLIQCAPDKDCEEIVYRICEGPKIMKRRNPLQLCLQSKPMIPCLRRLRNNFRKGGM